MAEQRKVGEILLTEEEIRVKVTELADKINADYKGGNLLVIGILKGCFVFVSDLVRKLQGDIQVQFIERSLQFV